MQDPRMDALWTRMGALSPEKRLVLLQKLRSQGWSVPMRPENSVDILTSQPDLVSEAYLDPAIKPSGKWIFNASPGDVFLTGATGFLGAFLLTELLQRTEATVWCLVRAADKPAALKRVLDNLESYGLSAERAKLRVKPLCGDLGSPLMGLSPAEFDEVSRTVDVVYHNGALMNFMYGYDAFIGANVVGTQEALRLACAGKPKSFHYTSTLLMFMLTRHDIAGREPVTEEGTIDRGKHALGGYAQSKWVGEKLVSMAQERGLTTSTYRCAIIVGDSRNGAYDPEEAWGRMIKSAVVDHLALDASVPMYAISVDYAAQTIAALAQHADAQNRTFNIADPKPMALFPWRELRERGYPVTVCDGAAFYGRLRDDVKQGRNTALAPLLSFLEAKWPGNMGSTFDILAQVPHIETGAAQRVLRGTLDPDLIGTAINASIDRMVQTGWIPAPVKSP